jgi:glycosyltransferase involved in cell wall biosynthesis
MSRSMNFGLDVRPSLLRPTGTGTYVLNLARRLPLLAPADRFYFFSASFRDRYPANGWPPNATLVDRRLPVRALNLAWNRLGWPPLDRLVRAPLDLVHSPHPLIVPGKGRRIVTVHDLFFLKHPELTNAEIRRDYAPLVRDHVRRADGVLTVSHHTAAEIRRLLDVPEEKLGVTLNGVDPIFREPVSDEEVTAVLARHRLPRGAILYVGSEEQRKNLVTLVMAYMGIRRRGHRPVPPLVLVGPGSHWAQGGDISGPQIRATGYLETREIRVLMAACALLVLVSYEEGFGLPVAEALSAGLPVVCSRGSALEEIAGEAATLVDPHNASSIASGIERVLDDADYAEEKRQAGRRRSIRFDWDQTAAETLAFYRKILGR